jgi:hypothetical protein
MWLGVTVAAGPQFTLAQHGSVAAHTMDAPLDWTFASLGVAVRPPIALGYGTKLV